MFGSGSLIVTPVASATPLFVTVIVKLMSEPAFTLAAPAVFMTPSRSGSSGPSTPRNHRHWSSTCSEIGGRGAGRHTPLAGEHEVGVGAPTCARKSESGNGIPATRPLVHVIDQDVARLNSYSFGGARRKARWINVAH